MPQEQVTITGLLDGTETKGNKTTYKVKKDASRQFPDWYVGFFEPEDGSASPPQLKAGHVYVFTCNVREKDGKKYYNFVSVNSVGAGDAATPKAEAKPASAPTRARSEPQAQTPDPRSVSIERQVAVKAVTELVAAGKVPPEQFSAWFDYLCALMSGQPAKAAPGGTEPGKTEPVDESGWDELGK